MEQQTKQMLGAFALVAGLVCGGMVVSSLHESYIPNGNELRAYSTDCIDICAALFQDKQHTAALTASSPWLAHTIAKYVPMNADVRILEVGSGPGTITRKILERMTPGSTLDVVEYNERLYTALCDRLGNKQSERVHFYCSAIEAWDPPYATENRYDVIISTIPRTQLPYDVMTQILDRYNRMLKQSGVLVGVTLLGAHEVTLGTKKVRKMGFDIVKHLVPSYGDRAQCCTQEVQDYERAINFIRTWEQEHFAPIKTELVSLNVPPVYVMSLRKHV